MPSSARKKRAADGLLVSQGPYRIDSRRPAGGDERGRESHASEDHRRARVGEGIARADAVEQGVEEAAQSHRAERAQGHTQRREARSLAEYRAQDVCWLSAQSHPNADLMR